ncbi:hypothetical protein [Loktanella sp. IMCC34160]|uniref:hypothetical protein n=1 Tax=Loktanella sp. IMCC34160 TaxID=2510646 RepID=UPI0013EB2DB2|nr:hypothetical protein [Loktanella sp. IMCC34160]
MSRSDSRSVSDVYGTSAPSVRLTVRGAALLAAAAALAGGALLLIGEVVVRVLW